MTSQPQPEAPMLFTAEQAAELLQVSPSWLRRKAAARAIACTFIGKHLRFSPADLAAIINSGAKSPTSPGGTHPTKRQHPAA